MKLDACNFLQWALWNSTELQGITRVVIWVYHLPQTEQTMHTRFLMDQFTVSQVCLLQLRNQKETLVVNLKLGSGCKSVFSNCES